MEINQYSIWWVDLNPTKGSEQRGIRPCLVVSPDESNENLPTSVVVPLTTKQKFWPTVVKISSTKPHTGSISYALIEQIRTVSQERFTKKVCEINQSEIREVKEVIRKFLVD